MKAQTVMLTHDSRSYDLKRKINYFCKLEEENTHSWWHWLCTHLCTYTGKMHLESHKDIWDKSCRNRAGLYVMKDKANSFSLALKTLGWSPDFDASCLRSENAKQTNKPTPCKLAGLLKANRFQIACKQWGSSMFQANCSHRVDKVQIHPSASLHLHC